MQSSRRSPPSKRTHRLKHPSRKPSPRHEFHSGRRSDSAPNWPLIGVLGGAGLLLIIAISIVAVKAFSASKPTPTIPPVTKTHTPVTVVEATPTISTATLLPIETVAPTAVPITVLPDIPSLQQLLFNLVNEDRKSNGLTEVSWEGIAAVTGTQHAQEMARYGYMSHWNLAGYGPDARYSIAGGLNSIYENISMYQHSSGAGPSSQNDWEELIKGIEKGWMESPGHRANILAPEHTHVGIGIAYEPSNGWLAITQEFVNQYITIQPLLQRVGLGSTINLSGRLGAKVSNPMLNLAYEPLPVAKKVVELMETGAYNSPAENFFSSSLVTDSGGRFEQEITLDNGGQPGLYHVRVWLDTEFGQVLATDIVIEVH